MWGLGDGQNRGVSEDLGQWGVDQSLLMMHFWPQLPHPGRAVPIPVSVRLCPADTLWCSEICLGAAWCHGNVCVLLVPAKGWRIPDFCHYFRADSITRLAWRTLSPSESWNSGCWVCPSLAVPPDFFRKQLYLHIFLKKVVNGSDRYLLLLLSNTGLIVFCP